MPNSQPVARESVDLTREQREKLRELFPEAFTEGRIDFEKLRATLGDFVDDRPERYSFSWAGKRDAIRLLQMPTRATLVPDREESVNFDDTQHLFIEGDNLEVLKILYKSYFGRIKLIYIDPPYNTGNDFIYPDNYADPLDTYLQLTGQKDTNGNLLTSNPDTSGRYHSSWLSMMYPRLFLARQLLHEDGVIFISINDVELPNLRLMMNELFGEEQFIGTFVWKSRHNVDSRNKTGLSSDHEYVLIYGKRIRGRKIDTDKYSNPDNDPRGPWMSDNMVGLASKEKRPNLHYDLINPETNINYGCPPKGWRYSRKTMASKVEEGRVLWPSNPDGRPREKKFLAEIRSHFTGISSFMKNAPTTSVGTNEIRDIFGSIVFDFPKPVGLLKTILKQATEDDDIVLDFFAGASPTYQAVVELNRKDGSQRRSVLVQLPEPTDEGSPAKIEGFQTIADIGTERMRRVINQMKVNVDGQFDFIDEDNYEDLGFKVFKLAESNMRLWTGVKDVDTDEYVRQMELFTDPLVEGWQLQNVIYEVALREGYSLNSTIEPVDLEMDNTIYRVTDPDKEQRFFICLDGRITPDPTYLLGLEKTDLFICRDVALDDTTAANIALNCRLKTI